MTTSIRILLVDDQSLLRMGFRMVLEAEPGFEVVGEAADGASGVVAAQAEKPDVILMDVRMPGMNGIDATAAIVRTVPESKILILTTFDLDEYAFAALRAGASGFLLKDARPAELITAIRAVAAGDAVVSPRVTKQLLDLFGSRLPATHEGAPPSAAAGAVADASSALGARLEPLTEREREVLVAIAEGLSNSEIAEQFVVSESTVKTHVGRVLMKLGVRDRVQAVIVAYETGLVLPKQG
ncbi:response regulator [Subtercola vilae]|uniref:DNA-binding response regulator n=1 Tax=Subtercola vilae TaxID=2056433 RepID=A0A4T2CCC6_9MICO|nr:response regulator transcription factor [Subtercola vilae]TIH40336.1 DNA-binding response regulator [Subtercola vilae]